MIISPTLLRENIISRLNSMLIKVKDKAVDLNSPVGLSSWNSFEELHSAGWKMPKKSGEYKIISTTCVGYKELLVIVQNSNNETLNININSLNIEDIYKLYFEISNIITAAAPVMLDLSEELHKYDN